MRKITFLLTILFTSQAQAIAPSQVMGQGLYEQKGSNSCLFCHGIDGKGGNVAAAAKLNSPKTWKAYKALGGDAAFAKDPAGFRAKLKKATVDLIKTGAIRHNASYKEAGFDWSKIAKYDGQMMGLGGAASTAWLKKYAERGVNGQIAAEAVYLHLETLDSQGVLK